MSGPGTQFGETRRLRRSGSDNGAVFFLHLSLMKTKVIIAAALLSVAAAVSCARGNAPQAEGEQTQVVCSNGTFIGVQDGQIISYKGIPYAVPPVGALRWKAPVAAPDGNETYQADSFGYTAHQTEASSEPASFLAQSEDCLTLNVWRNISDDSKNKPVVVFIHGGDYSWGGSADPSYDAHNILEENPDIVFVTINYRLGMLGFMDLSPLKGGEAYPDSHNLGLLDQVCALQWVQRNIAAFGGDPDNVTVMGESAGAGSISLLLLMKESKGLFRRAIIDSGSLAFVEPTKDAVELTEAIMELTGATSVDDLLALSGERLAEIGGELGDWYNYPIRDGKALPEDIQTAFNNADLTGVDILIGSNRDESKYWILDLESQELYEDFVATTTAYMYEEFDDVYKAGFDGFLSLLGGDSLEARIQFICDYSFRIPAIYMAETAAANGGRAYMYYWVKESGDQRLGACHSVELAYLFDHPDDTDVTAGEYNESLAKAARDAMFNFARTGDPSTEDLPWPSYDAATRATMVFSDASSVENDPLSARRQVLAPLLPHILSNRFYMYFSEDE